MQHGFFRRALGCSAVLFALAACSSPPPPLDAGPADVPRTDATATDVPQADRPPPDGWMPPPPPPPDVIPPPDGWMPPPPPPPDGAPPPPPGGCTHNTDCASGQVCVPMTAGCGVPGMCVALPPGPCPRPGGVCGCDGRTYTDACEALRADAGVATLGPCGDFDGGPPPPPPPSGCMHNADCPAGDVCVQMVPGCGPMSGMCLALPPGACPTTMLGCGCDGRTYTNLCDALRADVRIASVGACPGTDGGVPDASPPPPPPPPGDGGTCSVVGTFTISLGGMTMYFRFRADGTWSASSDLATIDSSPLGGTYTYTGGRLDLREGTPTMPPGSSCTADQVGSYTAAFTADCAHFTLTLVTDACDARSAALDGATFDRR